MKTGVLIATGFGVLLAAVLVGFVGLRQVVDAVASIGWWGFAALCGFWMAVLIVLGLAWYAGAPGLPPNARAFSSPAASRGRRRPTCCPSARSAACSSGRRR